MKLTVPALAACLLLVPLAPAGAATATGEFVIKGAGSGSCEQYVKERAAQSKTYALFGGWLAGFLSGYNQFADETFDIAPWQSLDLLAALLENYCKANPATPFANAVGAMIQALAPTRLRIRSESLDIKEGEQSITLFRDVLRAAQDRLKEFGYYTGTPDGAFGPATRAALQAFQRERKLAETGLPDQATLYELFR